ncbi:MAG: hypothetical protein KC474_07730 [Cyanobacteria bacterium HKST-UBA04]|nr:hypothetical protein [Cyanobacteria bacterium HKST-UBA04]MCA9842532.1 hypothetical protein [Cyanobacteria bacterium HKST-UBA03]
MSFTTLAQVGYTNTATINGFNRYKPVVSYKPFTYGESTHQGGYNVASIIALIKQLLACRQVAPPVTYSAPPVPAYQPPAPVYEPPPAPVYEPPAKVYEQAALVGRFRKQTNNVNRIISDYNNHAQLKEFAYIADGMHREIQELKDIAVGQDLAKIMVTGGEGKAASFALITKDGSEQVSQADLEKFGTILDPTTGQYVPLSKEYLADLLGRKLSDKYKYGGADNPHDDIGGMLGHYYALYPEGSIYYKCYDITAQIQSWTPVMLDLDGNGFNLTFDQNTAFDLNGDGQVDQVSWMARGSGDAFLALDRNGNGTIDSGKELFGDQHGATNGYAELAKFDENGDGLINSQDSVFGSLKAWVDTNANGISEAGELKSMADIGLSQLKVAASQSNEILNGNQKILESTATLNGQQIETADVLLNALAVNA